MINGYIEKSKRKKILLISDDIRSFSGVGTMAREIVTGTAHVFNWVNIGGAVKHPEEGKKLDLSQEVDKLVGTTDSSVFIYPMSGYGNPDVIRQFLKFEQPDAIMLFTDPRYFTWLFQIESEIRKKIPIIYYNIWDDLPYPMYNKSFYESCDALFGISKQTVNINKVVLGEVASEKMIKYIPHGINENIFFPITKAHPEYLALQQFKQNIFKGKSYDFTMLYNARNIRRKSVPDLMLAYKLFVDKLDIEQAKKCAFILHTHIRDENGTDLEIVKNMIYGNDDKYNIIFLEEGYTPQNMNLLYNACDLTSLISSNEGWGLSITEAMMCGKMFLANVTGGMQDQMRFEDENGKWIEFTKEFGSNHFGKYKKHGKWVLPVFSNSMSIVGSLPTPYIFDDRVDFRDVADNIKKCYDLGDEKRNKYGMKGYEWVTSKESNMSSTNMCSLFIENINDLFNTWQPRYKYELINLNEVTPYDHKIIGYDFC